MSLRFVLCNCMGDVNRLARMKRELAIVDACAHLASDCHQYLNHECTRMNTNSNNLGSTGCQPVGFRRLAETRALQSSPQMNGFPQMFRKGARKSANFAGNAPHSTLNPHFFTRLLDYVPDVERRQTVSISLFHHTVSDSANFFGGPLGANVILPDQQHHVLNKLERVSQH